MNQLAFTVRPSTSGKKVIIELDADKLERVASSLGMYSSDFIESVERAEKDYKAGRIKRIFSLKELRKRK